MERYCSIERNVQILIQLLKKHGIRKCIASPGTVNISFVGSLQNDDWFEVYSCVDERSAAYMACGLAEETGEPVIITCTGATASRNYFSALTEAFYRKIPIIAVTASPPLSMTGHNVAQFIDRSEQPKDIKISSYVLQSVKDEDDEWDCEIKVNRGLNELERNGGGPVHFNLISKDSYDFHVKEIRPVNSILRLSYKDVFPKLPYGNIGIFVSSHHRFSEELSTLIDDFCFHNNAVVLCDHTSGYYGKYKVLPSIWGCQTQWRKVAISFDLIIHIGEVSGDYYTHNILGSSKQIWRVSEDGQIRDTFHRLKILFDMEEDFFFRHVPSRESNSMLFYESLSLLMGQLRDAIPDSIPFSNIWITKLISQEIPSNAVCHLGILNTLRSWNLFNVPSNVPCYCNVGGFGIDGGVSTLIGASFSNKDKLYYGFFGDLAFFYDLNSVANRHVGDNVRIMVINNGKGVEFRNPGHPASIWGDNADKFFAAGGHFGNQSRTLLKNYTENLGFRYLSAATKYEFLEVYKEFLSNEKGEQSIIFEVFVNAEDDSKALSIVRNLMPDGSIKKIIRNLAYDVLPESTIKRIKVLLK